MIESDTVDEDYELGSRVFNEELLKDEDSPC